ncbi:AbrB/MazE/SpoVT family DNA-binding domain-containing protein [Chitinimonas koreensis]|uniref:AbrB/MazE/SpoVT family DNA-binding domain-containing protein n=1 Tax=Chitinimonas koreensis TaxID=356302 RepID=UPI0004065B3D|nr:AbrB/MazE/SpoVT family DNA-binding domain-containing protein [Chitinimonas koreensis]QNM95258.1 AbrB/MazE/SpoVT family DNA-binding domain-containing protein [Chitinimonas koreensis]
MSQVVLRKVGSSFVTTIPAEIVHSLHLAEGQKFEVTPENGRLLLTPVDEAFAEGWAAYQEVLEQYRPAFQKLAEL